MGKSDPEVITQSGLRALVVTTVLSRSGIQMTSASVDEAWDAVVELLSSVISDLFPYFAARTAASSPAVLAELGVAGHQAMPWADGDKINVDKFRQLLANVNWSGRLPTGMESLTRPRAATTASASLAA
ncbi:hypothetical protein ACH40E_13930 [Streptomyces acidicola]|uniref:hypothetical protein n=1 Tax=Streptomyces acidicola TaxID=2596892 RepID=UPI0037950F2A